MIKEILFDQEARVKILKGLNITAKAVSSTLGPKGQNVIFEESTFPTITKDGVTVAQQIFLEDKFENMGVMLAREAAQNTNREAGDGTTTTVALLASIVNEANKYIIAGMNPILIKRGMDFALNTVLDSLKGQVRQIKTDEEKLQIATISANNDKEIGEMIHTVIKNVSTDGIVTIQTSSNLKTEVEYVKGTKLSSGFQSGVFINNSKKLSCEIQNPTIVICSDNLTNQSQLIPLIEKLVVSGRKNIVLFANAIEGSALAFLIQNHIMGKFTCVPIKLSIVSDYHKDLVYDLATLTQTTVLGIEESVKIEDANLEQCGICEDIIIDRDSTIVSGGKGNIDDRILEVKTLLEQEKDLYKIEKLKNRLGRLTGSIASIKVGGASETEQTEIKYRIEDALNATKSAIEEGIVEGGGVALLKCSNDFTVKDVFYNQEFGAGVRIINHSLREPIKAIVFNAGENGDTVADKVLETGKGYNALTGTYVDLFEEGIIDPFRVVRQEIINAVATAGILITSGAAIVNKVENK